MTGQFKILISSLYNKKQFTNQFTNPSPQMTEVEQQSYSKNY